MNLLMVVEFFFFLPFSLIIFFCLSEALDLIAINVTYMFLICSTGATTAECQSTNVHPSETLCGKRL